MLMIKLIGLNAVQNLKLVPNIDMIDFNDDLSQINELVTGEDIFEEEPVKHIKGNILYTAPELLSGVGKISKADVFS